MEGFIANATTVYGNSNNTTLGNGSFTGMPAQPLTWGWWLLQFGTPVILLLGIPGNILSFLVMKSRRYRNKSYSHYLCTLAVFDSLVLIGKFLNRIDSILKYHDGVGFYGTYGDAACKTHNFAEHVCYLMSSWLVLCMTLERFIAVNFPFKKDIFCKPRNAVTVILVVFAVMSYSQIFRLIIIESDHGLCTAPSRYTHIYVALHIYMYQLVLQFMLPAILILVCNLSILMKIRRLRNSSLRMNGQVYQASQQTYNKRHHKTTCMLLVVSFTYVLTLLPLIVLSLMMHISVITNQSLAQFLFIKLNDVRMLFEVLSEVNYAINFYIYVLSGAQFRYALRHICSRRYSFISSPAPTEKVFQFRKSASNS